LPVATLAATAMFLSLTVCEAQVISSTPSQSSGANGLSVYVHGSKHRTWVRGSASVNADTGVIRLKVQLESDSMNSGPKGNMTVSFNDSNGKNVVRVAVGEVGMGGKRQGNDRVEDFFGHTRIPVKLAHRIASVNVSVKLVGHGNGYSGVNPDHSIFASRVKIVNPRPWWKVW